MAASNYPSLTLIWQMIAFVNVSIEAMRCATCDMFVDTYGVAVAYPFVKLLYGARVVSYTHYPMISSDMLDQINSS
jgi:alpha-1,2-mannosyltransferase